VASEQNLDIISKLEEKLQSGQLALIQIHTIADLQGCHGFGAHEIPIGTSREYVGLVDIKKERSKKSQNQVTFFDEGVIESLRIFDKGKFVNLGEKNYGDMASINLMSHQWEEIFSVHSSNLNKIKLIEFKDENDLKRKMFIGGSYLRGSSEIYDHLPVLTSINVFVGESSILYNYIVDSLNPFSAHNIFTKLNLPISDALKGKVHKEALTEVIDLFRDYSLPTTNTSTIRQKLDQIKEHNSAEIIKNIEIESFGIKIDAVKFVAGVEREIGKSSSKNRSFVN
jgi:hypothetical protein